MMGAGDIDAAVKATARDWLLRLELEQPSAEEQQQFQAWRTADPRHDAAYRRFEAIWRDAASLQELKSLAPLNAPTEGSTPSTIDRSSTVQRPSWMWGGVALAASIVLGLIVFRFDLVTDLVAPSSGHFATDTGELRNLQLADGSTVALGARSTMEVSFRDDERHVSLTAGEAYFSVTKDPLRPFVVEVGDKQVRVLGTAFEVRRQGEALHVSVVEGAVEITQERSPSLDTRLQNPSDKQVLHAGEELRAEIGRALQAPAPIPHRETAAWRHGRRVYVDAPLREVVADANRYSNRKITIDDPRIADLSVSVTYPSDRVDEMLSALTRSLPIELEQNGKDILSIKAK